MGVVCVTGATGQDGTLLLRRLLNDGHEIHVSVRAASIASATLPHGVMAHVADLEDPDALPRLVTDLRPNLVFNLGGLSSVAHSWEEPAYAGTVNGVAVAALLDAACALHERGHDIRVMQASSAEIFGDAPETPQNENTPMRPVTPYGAAKAYAHHLVGVYRRRGLFASTAILYNHESELRPPNYVARKITMAVAGIALGLQNTLTLGNMAAMRDWGWAPDYVDAMLRIIHAPAADDFVVASGASRSVGAFARAAFHSVGIRDWMRYVVRDDALSRPGDMSIMRGDAGKIRRELGWQPSIGFEELVRRMVDHDIRLLRESQQDLEAAELTA